MLNVSTKVDAHRYRGFGDIEGNAEIGQKGHAQDITLIYPTLWGYSYNTKDIYCECSKLRALRTIQVYTDRCKNKLASINRKRIQQFY